MRNFAVILAVMLTLTVHTVRAQYYSVNVDYKTMEAMSEAFTTEAAMETLHNDNLQKIYDSYKAAEIASAGIFSSKFLDRQALTNLDLWDDRQENYYYTRIYNIVSQRIIPKTITCASMMVEDPSTAIYWGSYLLKCTEDVKSLCQQFESVVTNSTLSFSDLPFLQITDELRSVFSLTGLGGIDWKSLFEHLGDDIASSFSKDALERDLDNLISKGVGLAGTGYGGSMGELLKGSAFNGTFQQKLGSIITLVDNAAGLYSSFKDNSAGQVLTRLVGEDKVYDLFNLGTYDMTRWIDDYASAAQGQYYTQRVYICRSDNEETVYEDVFDSYSMDWDTFMAQMNARLSQYNSNGDNEDIKDAGDLQDYIGSNTGETGYTYYIRYDDRHYYTATDARKIAGASSATFSINCHDGSTLGKGSTTYKCGSCGKTVNAHTKQCSMLTTLDKNDKAIETGELEDKLTQFQGEADELQRQLDVLNKENSELLRGMSTAGTSEEYDSYRAKYEQNKARIDALQSQLGAVNDTIFQTREAISEAESGERVETDDYNRIPKLMKVMEDAYHIAWTDNGSWSGYSFIRHGTVGSVKGEVTFRASLSIARTPKYFLGIKIHRAIVQIDWQLTSDWSDSSVVETMDLDSGNSDEANATLVNKRMSELAQEYPGCDVSVEYSRSPDVEVDGTDGVRHLLWASDRLDIARGIEARLARIYTDLVMIEKFLHYKHSLLDWAQDLVPKLNADKDRKTSIAERCRRRWLHNGGSAYYEWEDEDDNYEQAG